MVDFQQIITGRKIVRGVPIPTKTFQKFERAAGRGTSTGRAGPAAPRTAPKPAPKPAPEIKQLAKPVPTGINIKTALAGGRLTRKLVEREAVRGSVTGLTGVVARAEIEKGQEIIARRERARKTISKDIAKVGERAFKKVVSAGAPSRADIGSALSLLGERPPAAKPEFRQKGLSASEILEAQRFGATFAGGAAETAITFLPSIPVSVSQVVTKPIETATGTVEFAVTQPGRFAGGVVASTAIGAGIGRVVSKVKPKIVGPKVTTQEAVAKAVVDIETGRGFGEVLVTRAKGKPIRSGFEFIAKEFTDDLTKIDTRFTQVPVTKQAVSGIGRTFAKTRPTDAATRSITVQLAKTPKGPVGTVARTGLEQVSEFRGPGQIAVAGRVVDVAAIKGFKGLTAGDVFKAGRVVERPVTGLKIQVAQVAKGAGAKQIVTRGAKTITKTDKFLSTAATEAAKAAERAISELPRKAPTAATTAAPLAAPISLTRKVVPQQAQQAGPPSQLPSLRQITREPPARVGTQISRRFDSIQGKFSSSALKTLSSKKQPKLIKTGRAGQARTPIQRRTPIQIQRQIKQPARRQVQAVQPAQRQKERQRFLRLQTVPQPKVTPVLAPTFAAAVAAAPPLVSDVRLRPRPATTKKERFRFLIRKFKIRKPSAVVRV
jgi:hypothetical protein